MVVKRPVNLFYYEKIFIPVITLFFILGILHPSLVNGQALIFSYSYQNVTRNTTGGTLENGDIIEVHALVKVDKKAKSFYYIDTVRSGTQFVNGSLKIVTNEGLDYLGPYTDASGDDKGVYDGTGSPRIRINLGTSATNPVTGAGFGSTSGGGTVTPGDKPKFYGTTLFMVSYRLKITASFGDTIHLTGNYYFDTSGINRTYRFNYPGIKIIKNSGLCNNFSSASFTADSSFGTGIVQNRALAAIVPGYTKVNLTASAPQDNYYSIVNNTSGTGKTDNSVPYATPTPPSPTRVFGVWDIIGDHTGAANPVAGNLPAKPGDNGGYMLVVNAAYPTGEAYRQTISNVCPNTNYEFSAWVRNICGYCGIDVNGVSSYTPGVLPNLSFAVNDVDYYTSGDIPYTQTWQKRGFMYKTGPGETSFTISIKNNAAGGGGNDWVLDDIKLVTCYPNLIMNPSDTATACANWPAYLSDTVKSYFDNYTHYRWEKSWDGINWTPVNAGSTRTPYLENGLWVYHVDTVFTAVAADSGTFFRMKVATSALNLNDTKCAVDNSQKIFLKVYSSHCSILDAQLLNFSGGITGDRATLKWTSQDATDVQQYDIEKSADGINFKKIGGITATKGDRIANYIFNDPESVNNITYFRLKIINENKSGATYSKIISLFNRQAPFKISTVNPFTNVIKMDVFLPAEGTVEFNLCNMYGDVVSKNQLQLHKGNSQAILGNVDHLPPGLYILRAIFNGVVVQNKLIKNK